jgi:UDP-N-acetylmuramoyl-L-alanyl-D-glutamate--2,6-diaminopimelate ligase
MHVIGITGTKGKTTTATMLSHILGSVGIPTGYIGTNGISYGSVERTTANTTPDPLTLQKTLYDMHRSGIRAVVMEVSSQGLMQSRVAGVKFGTVLFTNLYLDHIGTSEHPTFEHYRSTKHSLFTDFASQNAVWNIDDPATPFMRLGCTALRNLTISEKESHADYLAEHMRPLRDANGLFSLFRLIAADQDIECRLRLLGEHNVYNALLAAAVAHGVFQVPLHMTVAALENLAIRGRAECIPLPSGALCIIDYAHNGESLRHLLTSLRVYQPSRLICLFGSVGERTQVRRRELGEVACELADLSILTSDNPGTEDPMQIIDEIAAAFGDRRKAYIKIPDRSDAIRCAVSILQKNDILVLAGKGHEEYQLIGREKIPFSEREIIRDILENDPILLPQ